MIVSIDINFTIYLVKHDPGHHTRDTATGASTQAQPARGRERASLLHLDGCLCIAATPPAPRTGWYAMSLATMDRRTVGRTDISGRTHDTAHELHFRITIRSDMKRKRRKSAHARISGSIFMSGRCRKCTDFFAAPFPVLICRELDVHSCQAGCLSIDLEARKTKSLTPNPMVI